MSEAKILHSKINQLRKLLANDQLRTSLLLFFTLLITSLVALLFLEGIFWFGSAVRWFISILTLSGAAAALTGILRINRQINSGQFRGSSDEELARKIGKDNPTIKDKLVNAMQLDRKLADTYFSKELILKSIESIEFELSTVNIEHSADSEKNNRKRKTFIAFALIVSSLLLISPSQLKNAASRLMLPGEDFTPALPFLVEVTPGNIEIIKGDTLILSAAITGNFLPAEMSLVAESKTGVTTHNISSDSTGKFKIKFDSVEENFSYRFKAEDPKVLKSWIEYLSDDYRVSIINRPSIQRLSINLDFPDYSNLKKQVIDGNIGEIIALKGTEATVTITSNKLLAHAEIFFSSGEKIKLIPDRRSAHGRFVINENGSFHITLHDTQGVENLDPVEFGFLAMRDEFPALSLLEQPENFDLDASLEIPLHLRIDDDFGISQAGIALRITNEYSEAEDSSFKNIVINLPPIRGSSLEFLQTINLGSFELAPNDMVEYYAHAYDNDTYSGPKMSRSRLYFARFPTLAELYERMDEETQIADKTTEETLDEAKDLREAIEELSEEFKKNPELDWAKKQKIEETLQKQEEIEKSLESITEKLDKLIEEAEKNNLLSEESLKMYMELQTLFKEIATPELLEAMDKMREAMNSINEDEIALALREFSLSQEQFTRELERTLEIFRRVQAEQKMDEIVERMRKLTEEQEKIAEETSKLSNNDEDELNKLANREADAAAELEDISEEMINLEKITEPFPEMPTSNISDLRAEMELGALPNSLQRSEQAMNKSDLTSSKEHSEQASGELSKMLDKLSSLKEEMRRKQLQDVMAGFQKITRKAIQLSKNQEELALEGEGLKSNSPNLDRMATRQEKQRRDLSGMVEDLIELSRKTFGISPSIARSIGKTSGAMSKAVKSLSNRNTRQSSAAQSEALGGLNQTILFLRGAMSRLSASGSGTGFEQYMQQMQQMADMQGGINSESLNMMPGMKPGGSRSSRNMRNLAARQEQLRRSLEKMMKEMAGKNEGAGRLDAIANEMNEVVKDLNNRRLTRKTIQRQQRILSRMLDSQKSMREREKSKKRKSKIGTDVARGGPIGLPYNRGERGEILNHELINALREGYSLDYQNLIRRYYDSLRSAEKLNE